MFVLIGFAIDLVIASVLYVPLVLIWVFYVVKKKPSPRVATIGTSILGAVYFLFVIFLFCWQCWAQDDMKGLHKTYNNPGTIELVR